MRKTLKDLAKYLKSIIMPETDEKYAVNPLFENISSEENIRAGVLAFRAFLIQLYDLVIIEADKYDDHKKIAHEYENRTTLSGYYPFLHNIKTILMRIGYYGVQSKDNQFLTCTNKIFNEKIPVSKNLECLRFLTDCGISIVGIDLTEKKQNLAEIGSINVSYPANSFMLIGLKVMALAEIKLGTLDNQDLFMRCDYRVLKTAPTAVITVLKDTIKPLSLAVQDFILQLHQQYLGKGVNCNLEIKGFFIYFKYTYKRKELWGINASLNNGFQINVKAKNMDKYSDTIETFPPVLQDIISNGYGCGRKSSVGHCDGGCRGMIIALDDTVLELSNYIETWFDKELQFL